MGDPASETDPNAQAAADTALVGRWIAELDASDRDQQSWSTRAKKIIKRYKDERADTSSRKRKMAILWANIQVLGPATYARVPQAVVSRRFKDADPVGRYASEILERAINYSLEENPFDQVMISGRDSWLLVGRGQAWARYVPHMKTVRRPLFPVQAPANDSGEPQETAEPAGHQDAAGNPIDPDDVKTDADGPYREDEEVDFEEVIPDYVSWDDFGTNPARTWAEVRMVWRRAYMTREELVKRFGEVGKQVPLCDMPGGGRSESGDPDEQTAKGEVYEIWDKSNKRVIWLSRGYSTKPLDVKDDPLGLKDFFPCPKPLLATVGPDSVIPIPDFVYYQDQAEEVDDLTDKIGVLQGALRVIGIYPGQFETKLSNMFTSGTGNKLIPIDAWAQIQSQGGMKGIVDWFPLEMVVTTLKSMFETRQQILGDIYQITGISDIVRGDTDPNETATAQGIKSEWGSLRVRDRQRELARFARDLIRIMGEIIAGKFGVDTLKAMTGVKLLTNAEKAEIQQRMALAQSAQAPMQQAQQGPAGPLHGAGGQPPAPPPPPVPPDQLELLTEPSWEDVQALLTNRMTRQFRIDIETDSTINPNENEEKARCVEFVKAVGEFLSGILPVVSASPAMVPVAMGMLRFLVRRFRVGRELEDEIETATAKIQQAAANGPPPGAHGKQPPAKDPAIGQAAMIAAGAKQMTAQAAVTRVTNEAQFKQEELKLRARKLQLDAVGLAEDPHPQVVI